MWALEGEQEFLVQCRRRYKLPGGQCFERKVSGLASVN